MRDGILTTLCPGRFAIGPRTRLESFTKIQKKILVSSFSKPFRIVIRNFGFTGQGAHDGPAPGELGFPLTPRSTSGKPRVPSSNATSTTTSGQRRLPGIWSRPRKCFPVSARSCPRWQRKLCCDCRNRTRHRKARLGGDSPRSERSGPLSGPLWRFWLLLFEFARFGFDLLY